MFYHIQMFILISVVHIRFFGTWKWLITVRPTICVVFSFKFIEYRLWPHPVKGLSFLYSSGITTWSATNITVLPKKFHLNGYGTGYCSELRVNLASYHFYLLHDREDYNDFTNICYWICRFQLKFISHFRLNLPVQSLVKGHQTLII